MPLIAKRFWRYVGAHTTITPLCLGLVGDESPWRRSMKHYPMGSSEPRSLKVFRHVVCLVALLCILTPTGFANDANDVFSYMVVPATANNRRNSEAAML